MLSEEQLPASPFRVMAISAGVAVGPVRLFGVPQQGVAPVHIRAGEAEIEQQRLHDALAAAVAELEALSERVAQTVGRDEADIFAAQQLMLQDPDLLAETEELITRQHLSAASALHQAAEHQARELAALDNELLAARSADVRDVAARAVRLLTGGTPVSPIAEAENVPAILVANDLTPSDTANLDPRTILGICTAVGGPTTHAAIIARALEIPAITGIEPQVLATLHDGQRIAIDGTQGLLYLHMDEKQERTLRETMQRQQTERTARRASNEAQWRNRRAATADGIPVQVFANVGDSESARLAGQVGAEGIGLLRTEFLFGSRPVFPDEQEQFAAYVSLFRAFAEHAALGKTIIARTLDAGADKPFPALEPLIGSMQEANPALGLRGARIHLLHEHLLRQQLRALFRAGVVAGITLHIMFPMIDTLEEVRRLKTVYQSVRQELQGEGVLLAADTQVGIMVETPAAALMSDVLAREVDFFSIGANDLFQYTMAADRTNSRVMGMFGVLQPAVWRLIEQVVCAGLAYNKTVALCGELAADPQIGPLLVGLGVQELSMSPPSIVRVKAALNAHTMDHWQQLAHEMLRAETAEDMQAVLQRIEMLS